MSFAKSFARPASIMLAALIVILVATSVQRAAAVTEAPNAAFISYTLASGASSAAITPAGGTSVLVMGSNTTDGDRGVGFVTLLHVESSFLEWAGINSPTSAGTATITQGFSGSAGTNIVQIDYEGYTGEGVFLQVHNTDSFVVTNTDTWTNTGDVTLMW